MRWILLCVITVLPGIVTAYEVVPVSFASQFVVVPLEDVTTEQRLIGTLNDFPHLFEFQLTEPIELYTAVSVLEPVTETTGMSIILVRELRRGVEDVVRISSDLSTWRAQYDPISGLTLLESQPFSGVLEPGTYRLEVSSLGNTGQYVLALGTEAADQGYFGTLAAAMDMRAALVQSKLGIIELPRVWIPLLLIGCAGVLWMLRRKLFTKWKKIGSES